MRIGIQLLSMKPGELGGQEVFVRRLIDHAVPLLGDDELILFLRPVYAEDAGFARAAADPRLTILFADPQSHYGPGYADWCLRTLAMGRLDCVFYPLAFFFPRPLPLPVAVHVPDLQHEYFPEYFSAEQLAWRRERIPESVRLAEAVITFSQFGVQSLIDKLGADPTKTFAIPLAGFTDDELHSSRDVTPPTGFGPDDPPYFFYPAADWPHKNHETLLRAFASIAPEYPDLHLALSGMRAERGGALRALARESEIDQRVHFLGRVSRSELVHLYRNAVAMPFVSRFEGFGIPLVEAMQCDCPILASPAAAVREVAGEAGLPVEDHSAAWAEAMRRVLRDRPLRRTLIEAGRRRSRAFSWQGCAAEHLERLRRIAQR